ncbi:hypothetical protein AAFJ72_13485 [Brevibacillus gelatini]|uniref:hypothetical protein n=1 Tax=Brevibacillus gelatini TaxID=1655277 RepID=UPI0026CC0FB2
MGLRSYRLRQGGALRRVLGVALAVGGITIFLYMAPPWVWYSLLAAALMGAGWLLYRGK